MKITTNSIYIIFLIFIFVTTLHCTQTYESIDHEVQELKHECLTKIKKFEKDLQQIFNNFPYPNKFQPSVQKGEENELQFVSDKHNQNLTDYTLPEKLEAGKETTQDTIESGKRKLQDTIESKKETGAQAVKNTKEKLEDFTEKGKEKAGKAINTAQEKTQNFIQAGKEKLQEALQSNIRPEEKKNEKIHNKIEPAKQTIHDKLAAGKEKVSHNLQQAKQKVSEGFTKGKNKLEKNIAAAAYNLQLHTHDHIIPTYSSYEHSNNNFEFDNNDRCIKIIKDKTPHSTKYVIQDTHKTHSNSLDQTRSNLIYLKKLQKYMKKNYTSKIANIIISDCINDIKNRRNKNHIHVIVSNKDSQEKYFIEVIPKKESQLLNRKKKYKNPGATLTYAHNPAYIL